MDDFFSLTKLGRRNQVNKAIPNSKQISSKKEFGESLERITLSNRSKIRNPNQSNKLPSTEVRQDLVNKFRRDLDKGNYEVRAEEIADKIVQRIREEKDRKIT